MALYSSLNSKVAFITGSVRGIGLSIADKLASNKVNLVINGVSDREKLEDAANLLVQKYQVEVLPLFGSVSSSQSVRKFYQEIFKKYKRLDILVNNAGILKDNLIPMTGDSDIDQLVDVNIKGVLYNIINASRLIERSGGGSIINLSSVVGRLGNAGQLVYSSTKAAVIGMTLTASKELSPKGIRVNAIAPGLIDTDMVKQIPEEKLNKLQESITLGRLGKVEDIANLACFLSADESSYITGQVIGVDGGIII